MGTTTDWTPQPTTLEEEADTPAGRAWARMVWLSGWVLPPLLMAGAYTILALTSETDRTGMSWIAVGFAFVLFLWLVFRLAVESAGLSRALAVGDAERLLAIATKQLRRRSGDAARAPFLVYKSLALEIQGAHAEALAAAEQAKPVRDTHALLATAVRTLSLVELGRTTDARALAAQLDTLSSKVDRRLDIMPHHYAQLARARLLAAEGKRTEADAELTKLIDDIRTGAALRERAETLRAASSSS